MLEIGGTESSVLAATGTILLARASFAPRDPASLSCTTIPILGRPLVRRSGELEEVSWQEAFEEIDRRLTPILAQHGRQSLGLLLGNPTTHHLAASLISGP